MGRAAKSAKARAHLLVEQIARVVEQRVGMDVDSAKFVLYDGKTGQPFRSAGDGGLPPTCLKRSTWWRIRSTPAPPTGPYSPDHAAAVGGKGPVCGQRFGEMEVWALEAYGSAYTLQEILTIKSDDVMGRVKIMRGDCEGASRSWSRDSESFKILVKELQSLGLQVSVESDKGEAIRPARHG